MTTTTAPKKIANGRTTKMVPCSMRKTEAERLKAWAETQPGITMNAYAVAAVREAMIRDGIIEATSEDE